MKHARGQPLPIGNRLQLVLHRGFISHCCSTCGRKAFIDVLVGLFAIGTRGTMWKRARPYPEDCYETALDRRPEGRETSTAIIILRLTVSSKYIYRTVAIISWNYVLWKNKIIILFFLWTMKYGVHFFQKKVASKWPRWQKFVPKTTVYPFGLNYAQQEFIKCMLTRLLRNMPSSSSFNDLNSCTQPW